MKITKYVLGLLSFFVLADEVQAAEKTCTNGDVSVLANGDHCFTEPSSYSITIFEMGLCTSEPTAPTTTANAVLTNCEAVFTSTTGSSVTVANGATSTPVGTFNRPANGTYTHAYMRLGNTFRIAGSVDFGAGHATITNRFCISATATTDNETGANGTCSSTSGATAGTVSTELTDFSGGNKNNETSATIGSLSAYLLDASQNLADATETTQAGADGILGVQSFSQAIIITDQTVVMDASIKVSQGMTISVNGANTVGFDSGPFVLVLSVN